MAKAVVKGKRIVGDRIIAKPPRPIRPTTIQSTLPQWSPYKVSPFGGDGRVGTTSKAIEAITVEHGIKVPEATRLIKLMRQDPKNPEFAKLTAQQIASLKAAEVGYDPWKIAPVSIETGEPLPVPGESDERIVLASTREKQIEKAEIQDAAIKLLEGKGLLSKDGELKLKAFDVAITDKRIKRALYDVGLTGKQVKEGITFERGERARAIGVLEPGVEFYEQLAKDFEKRHIKLADDKWVAITEFNRLPNKYKTIGLRQGFDPMLSQITADIKEFERTHIIFRGQGIPIKEWKELPQKYQAIAQYQGLPAMMVVIKKDIVRQDAIIATLDKKYEIDGGYNLPLALKDKAITTDDLRFVGFEIKDVANARNTVKASLATTVAVAGERNWLELKTGEIYSDVEHRAVIKKDPVREFDFTLTPASGRRLGVQVVSYILPATRAALPEVTIKDISAIEWGLTGVNAILIGTALAPGAIMGSLAGKVIVTGVSTTGSGLLGYTTVKNWWDLSPTQRIIGVAGSTLYALPLMVTVVRGVSLSGVKIPAHEGVAVPPPVWKGLSVLKNPVIGRSGGKWVIGGRNITLPEARLIAQGYKPELMLDTKVFVNPKALSRAGFSQTQIKYLLDSLKVRNLLAGKKSPYLSKDVLLEPTAYISRDEMAVWLRQIAKYNKKIKKVDMLYGGGAIKAQLAPELRGWRQMHDLDMHTSFTLPEAKAFVLDTLKLLRRLPGKGKYRVSPKSPLRIEKWVKGRWEHMNDLKSELIDPSLQVSADMPGSKLDYTGTYSYGRMVAEKAITVKYPGIGKFDIMSLSESLVRKGDTILRVRQTAVQGVAFRPPPRGIAKPGVPKDAADFYVILQSYEKGGILKAGLADDWLKSWAKAMGYSPDELARLFPKLKMAAIEVASKTPSNLIGYRFTPSKSLRVSPGASPSIIIHIPASLGASVSPSLASRISKSVSLYKLSPSARASISVTVSGIVPSGYPTMISSSTMKGLSSSVKENVSASVYRVSPKVSPSPSPKPSPKISPIVSPKLSPIISPEISPKISPKISPEISPKITPPEPKEPRITVLTRLQTRSPIPQPIPMGSIAWASGKRRGVRGLLVPQWFFIPPPFDQPKPISLSAPPLGAKHTDSASPYETIQVIGRSRRGVPRRVNVDLGWVDIEVINGKEIRFKGVGLETDVGTRMPSPTKGMDLGEGGFVGEPITQGISRPKMPKKKPRRKKRLTHYEYMTTLKGYRP